MKQRNHTADLLRLIAAFAVVCLHNFTGCGMIWSEEIVALARFAVPLFFLFSGYFSAHFTPQRKRKQALRLLALDLFGTALYLGIELAQQSSPFMMWHRTKELFSTANVINLLLFNESAVSAHLWFLGAMLYCVLLDLLVSKVFARCKNREKLLGLCVAILLFGGVLLYQVLMRQNIGFQLYHYRNFLFVGVPFYSFGRLFAQNRERLTALPRWGYAALIVGSCLLTLLEFRLLGVWEIYVGSILLAFVLMHLAVCRPMEHAGGAVWVLAWLGEKVSLPIYLVHVYFLGILKSAYYTNCQWQYTFSLYHLIAPAAFLISVAVGLLWVTLRWATATRKGGKRHTTTS